ncbi:hypothetical protein H8D29_01575 [PVC group bacterium]|nr:hypothetical protein [PVC group bacterium]
MHDQILKAGKNDCKGEAQGHRMTAISSHGVGKNVRILVGSLPNSYTKLANPQPL